LLPESPADAVLCAVDYNFLQNAHQKLLFVESFRARFSISKTQRAIATAKLADLKNTHETKSLQLDLFKAISGWHHMALIELIKVSKKRSPSWFSTKLGVPENEILLSLKRLERLELISKTSQGWVVNQDTVIADQGVSSDAIKNYHRQIMEKAIQALSFQGSEERYGSSSTMPIKVKSVDRAKKLIQKFRAEFANEISDPEGGEEIYGLSLQFFRLTQKTQETVK
jgi:uncharacterized protein (TIGR02147 family)